MAVLLGVDTGGTYTDAVLIRDETEVLASAKALTTRHDLAVGIGEAVRAVLAASGVAGHEIGMAALSTTLATNALVEGQGERVGLIFIGFREADLVKHGVAEALKGDPVCVLAGGHDHSGSEAQKLDETALLAFLETHKDGVSGWAVAAQFGTRNPGHELRVAEIIAQETGAPVTCSHQLSARLNGPKRAVTAVLNARLIGMIDRLIARAGDSLAEAGIEARLMVVRGDGALMSAQQARMRPIETILSGPAASIVGARWLTGVTDGLVSDIGGTTTDVAVLRDGRPAIDPDGARVGGFRTMVEAVAMRTTGLGGDSQVHVETEGLAGGVRLGPRRVVPVSLMAMDAPDVVRGAMEVQLRSATPGEMDARFARLVPGVSQAGLAEREQALVARIGDGVQPLNAVLRTRMDHGALTKLVGRGVVQLAGVTPSDASHVLGLVDAWDKEAARMAVELMARKRVGTGDRLSESAGDLARTIVTQLQEQTALALLETAFAEEASYFEGAPEVLARHVLTRRGLENHRGLLAVDVALNVPVVGLGASAPTYYPAVGTRLGCEMVLPEHAGVANAVGAIVGRVTVRKSGTITAPSEGRFRVHLDQPEDFGDQTAALTRLETVLRDATTTEARAAGAEDIEVRVYRDIKTAQTEARVVFVEAELTVEATGRPRVALG
ncbi:MAG: hydantoinase/oxoprolinase family protein [Aestuariivita sp.]|uniref:hydantoinase/oxoprolinase N-terminal domain-containing protein n=1 Tax=Aestuariivita sp. TaxID=1872407 RepID=UPI003BAE83E6